jgi:hypothetical protein
LYASLLATSPSMLCDLPHVHILWFSGLNENYSIGSFGPLSYRWQNIGLFSLHNQVNQNFKLNLFVSLCLCLCLCCCLCLSLLLSLSLSLSIYIYIYMCVCVYMYTHTYTCNFYFIFSLEFKPHGSWGKSD